MNVIKWTIGLAVIALGASPVLAQSEIQTAFNYELIEQAGYCCSDEPSCGCDEPSCGCEEPSCGCNEPSCGCDDDCCGEQCGGGCGDACSDCCKKGLADGLSLSGLGECCHGEPFALSDHVLQDSPFTVGGWIGLLYNSDNVRLSQAANDGLSFGDNPDRLNFSQANLFFERVADGSAGLDWGFRFDALYGVDAQQTQSFGNDDARFDNSVGFDNGIYGWALPQLYFEIAKDDWSIIAGKFYTLIGYEVVTDPDNFFATNALTTFNSEPFTHTGALATYTGIEGYSIYAGWTAGWDTGFDQANGGNNFLGGFSTDLSDDVTLTYITTWGNPGLRGVGFGQADGQGNGYSHSIVFDVAVTEKLNYVLHHDLVALSSLGGNVGLNDQTSVSNNLFYTIDDCWAAGSRIEWWKSDGESFYEITLGLNYRPTANVVIRPELRYDFAASDAGAISQGFANENDYNNETFNVDMIFTF